MQAPNRLPPATTVLLIARDAESGRPYREALAAAGHGVITGADTVSALRRAMQVGVDAVLVEADAQPLDGFAVAAILAAHASTAKLPVLILADREDQGLRSRAREAGAAGVLVQPQPAALTAVVARRLRGRGTPAPPLVATN